jgi:uncharacterized protein YaaQ
MIVYLSGYVPYFYTTRTDLTSVQQELDTAIAESGVVARDLRSMLTKRDTAAATGMFFLVPNYTRIIKEKEARLDQLTRAITDLGNMVYQPAAQQQREETIQEQITSYVYTPAPETAKKPVSATAAFLIPAVAVSALSLLPA